MASVFLLTSRNSMLKPRCWSRCQRRDLCRWVAGYASSTRGQSPTHGDPRAATARSTGAFRCQPQERYVCCDAGRERGLNFNEGNSVNRNIAALVAAVVLVGACSKNNDKSMADTMTKRGADTVSGG